MTTLAGSAERPIAVFFYGLFMDVDALRKAHVTPVDPRAGYVDGFALRIGQRATLHPSPDARVYGMVISLTPDEITRLYSGPGLEPYRPEAVIVRTLAGETMPALCYNLPAAPPAHERNAEYAERLQALLRRLDFPRDYVDAVG